MASESGFKFLDGVRRCSATGAVVQGKQVLRPVRFFVSDDALRIVSALRAHVESRLEELKNDKEARVLNVMETRVMKEDLSCSKNFEVLKAYAAHLFRGVKERKDLISCKEHRSALCYLALAYNFVTVGKQPGAKADFKAWGDLQGTRLRWLASYVIHSVNRSVFARSEELCILKGIYMAVNGHPMPEKPQRKLSEASMSSEARCFC
ncbi:Kcnh2 [Symbiodinium sp. CCMP2456]|nr:Kcnh2 [Symbiodinium sp. CCMP2456]